MPIAPGQADVVRGHDHRGRAVTVITITAEQYWNGLVIVLPGGSVRYPWHKVGRTLTGQYLVQVPVWESREPGDEEPTGDVLTLDALRLAEG